VRFFASRSTRSSSLETVRFLFMSEIVIYHVQGPKRNKPLPKKPPARRVYGPEGSKAESHVSKILLKLSKILALTGLAFLIFSYAPLVLNSLANYKLSNTEVTNLTRTIKTNANKTTTSKIALRYAPPIDPRLPKTNHLTITAIGVDTNIEEATIDNYETALKKGVWRVSDFGAPGDPGIPVILAAHRFGYLAWTDLYRRHNSFFNLPKLKTGDSVEIDYQQRKYVYEVYGQSEGPEIEDYTADLILYTCESLTGETRIFKYARLIKI